MKLFNILKNINTQQKEIKTHLNNINDYVVEHGTEYMKFASGRLVCWGSSGGVQIQANSSYTDKTITLPIAFANTDYYVLYGCYTSTTAIQNVGVMATFSQSTSSFATRVWRNVNTTTYGAEPAFHWLAIGTWNVGGG